MRGDKVRVLVVDDDFMIARLHAACVAGQEGYQVVGTAGSFEDAMAKVKELAPDLLILDVYLPGRSGLDLLRALRAEQIPCDTILISAAREIEIIEDAFRLGIFDYLIKPFDLSLLEEALGKYRQFRLHLDSGQSPDQSFVENLKRFRGAQSAQPGEPPARQKGIDGRTLERIRQSFPRDRVFRSAEEIAALAGLSRSTVRAYLDYLAANGVAEEFLQYGTVGRPQRLFRLKE